MKTEADANTVTHPEGRGQYPESQPVSVETSPASSSLTKAEPASLMEWFVDPESMERAYRKVINNKGAPGVEGMTVHQLADHLKQYWPMLRERLLVDKYRPSPVRAAAIPKPKGGARQLGIPTVTDRLTQQALSQVLMPIFDPAFSESSYGYRPRRSAKQAVSAMKAHVTAGLRFCRYADDVQVYVKNRQAGERVMDSLSEYLESSLRLTVNRRKSAVDRPWKRGYLGYSLTRHKQSQLMLIKSSLLGNRRVMGEAPGGTPRHRTRIKPCRESGFTTRI